MKAGWQIKPLGEICDILDNLRKPITKSQRTHGIYPYYGATGILDYVEGFLFDEPLVLVGEDGAKWASGEHTAFPVSGKCWVNNHAHVIRPHRDKIVDTWLINYLVHSDLSEFVSGLTVPKLNQGNLREIPVPFPAIQEQQRIVAILDQAFEGIAKARVNAEQNLQNARALFESHLQSVFSVRGELDEPHHPSTSSGRTGWVDTTIGECTKFIDYRGKTPVKTEFGTPLITAKNVKMGYIQDEPREYVSPDIYDEWMTRGIPRKGDVLFTTEAPLANVAQLGTDEKVVFAQRIIIMQPDKVKLDQKFLKFLLMSAPIQSRIHEKATGATAQGIKASLLKTIKISFPNTIAQQIKIAEQLESLDEETQRLEALYQHKIACLDELKKSLLQQAFAGEL